MKGADDHNLPPRTIGLDCFWIVKEKGVGSNGSLHAIGLVASGCQKAEKVQDQMVPACHRARHLWMTKGEKLRDQMVPACHRARRLWMTKGVKCGTKWFSHVIGPAASG